MDFPPVLTRDGAPFVAPVPAGDFLRNANSVNGQTASVLNTLRAFPLFSTPGQRIDQLLLEVVIGAVASFIRIGLYQDDHGYPGGLLFDSGQIAADVANVKTAPLLAPITLTGREWAVHVNQGGTPQVRNWAIPNYVLAGLNSAGSSGFQQTGAYTLTGVTGALPDPFPPIASVGVSVDSIAVIARAA